MSKKYRSMLLGGTFTRTIGTLLLISDSVIAGIAIGPDAVAGITLATPIYALSAFLGTVFSLGVPIVYSTAMGEFNKKRADQSFGFGLLMSVAVGITTFLATCLFGSSYLRSGSPSDAILTQAESYFFWLRFDILISPLEAIISSMVFSDGDETISTISSVVAGAGNPVMSILFCHFMGIGGIGLASFLSCVLSLGISLIHFWKPTNTLRWNFYFSFDLLKAVVRHSIVDSSAFLFTSVFIAVLNFFICTQFGSEYLILSSVVTLCREAELVFDGIGAAATPIFGVYVGEHSRNGLRSAYATAKHTAIIEGVVFTILLALFAPFVPRMLNVDQPELIYWIVKGTRLLALSSTFVCILFLLSSYYLVIDHITLGVVASALGDVVFSVALAVVFGKVWGIFGMFIGLTAAPVFAYAFLLLYLIIRYGWEDFPLLLSQIPDGSNCYIYNLSTEPEEIVDVQRQVEAVMQERSVDKQTMGRVMLLIEELYTLIREMNGNIVVLAECTVIFREDGIQIISKDAGVTFDVSDENIGISSLAGYTVALYLEKETVSNRHLATLGFNRSSFLIKSQSN